MKKLFQNAVIVTVAVTSFTACKKEYVQPAEASSRQVDQERSLILSPARNLTRKGTDSLIYNSGGALTQVIYSPSKYVTYLKSGNILTAKTFENNVLKLKVEYTISNGRTTQSKHTSYESSVGVIKTWLYDYNNDGRLVEKYNKDNSAERIQFIWVGLDNLAQIKWYSGANQHIATLQFTRSQQVDKIKINSNRSSLDPYLKIFGVPCGILSTGEGMSYPLSPASNFQESHTFDYDRNGYPVKLDVFDPATWTLKYTQTFAYSN
jgi:hypothetical protein